MAACRLQQYGRWSTFVCVVIFGMRETIEPSRIMSGDKGAKNFLYQHPFPLDSICKLSCTGSACCIFFNLLDRFFSNILLVYLSCAFMPINNYLLLQKKINGINQIRRKLAKNELKQHEPGSMSHYLRVAPMDISLNQICLVMI